ncbi:MAG: BlaI/MecI/CopY family transcriptional regulator [Defluviitaleaceae bacterium]|nr:BlaI/MecI/CopY family transcriptional regulator [Defluviitaleaceae bacterium]
MNKMRKLPDAEFDIMKVVWSNTPPITANIIMQQHGNNEGWRVQTAITLLLRLVERGFLHTEKNGKERKYFPIVNKEDYLKFETGNFIRQFHDNSLLNLVSSVYADEILSDEDINELLEWVRERRG